MGGYVLTVFYKENRLPTEIVFASGAVEVMDLIPKLLAKHADCHGIRVDMGATHLFTVDCAGKTIAP